MHPKKLAVIGHPISHSKSPLIHNYWIKRYGLKGSYEAVDLQPENFERGLRDLVDVGYSGFNITVPFKQKALEICDVVDDISRAVGAVNTITVSYDKLVGTNTDVFGFIENIKENAPRYNFTDGPIVIFGAGGAAKAILHAALKEGAPEITIINRTEEKAFELQKSAPDLINVVKWDHRAEALDQARLVVNTTTLGMTGQPDLLVDMFILSRAAVVADVVYTPLHTDFLQRAKARSNTIVTGVGMLVHQARPAFQSWFGLLPDVEPSLMTKVLKV